MGFVSSIFGGGNASKKANRAMQEATDQAMGVTKEARDQARADVAPWQEAGKNALAGLAKLVNDPQEQAGFIRNNPFYDAMANDATDKLFANAAARGKIGSGGTAEALQNSLMLMGQDLLDRQINARQNLSNIGLSAAGQAGSFSTGAANNLSNLITNQGNANATDKYNQAQAFGRGIGSIANAGMALWNLSDRHVKEDVRRVGWLDNGLPVYTFRYKGQAEPRMGVMAQDVEKVRPWAVMESDGVKFVNMEAATCP